MTDRDISRLGPLLSSYLGRYRVPGQFESLFRLERVGFRLLLCGQRPLQSLGRQRLFAPHGDEAEGHPRHARQQVRAKDHRRTAYRAGWGSPFTNFWKSSRLRRPSR